MVYVSHIVAVYNKRLLLLQKAKPWLAYRTDITTEFNRDKNMSVPGANYFEI